MKDIEKSPIASLFGNAVSTYTRARAIEDGLLVDVSTMAQEAGFNCPVALTSAVWDDCVLWEKNDNQQQVYQDQTGRLWGVLFMAFMAIRSGANSENFMLYELYRVPRDGISTEAILTTLKIIVGPGDNGELVTTILLPCET